MRGIFVFFLWLFTCLVQAAPGTNPFDTKPEFLPVDKAFTYTSERLESGETQLYWQITDGYYLYQKRLKFDGLPVEQHPRCRKVKRTATSFSVNSKSTAKAWS